MGVLTDFSIQIGKPGSDFILKLGIKRLLLGGIPIHTSVGHFVEAVLPSLHDFNGEVVGRTVVKKVIETLNVLFRIHINIMFGKQ